MKPLGSYSWFKKAMNKYWYPFVTRRWDQDDVVFLNWGYEEEPPMGLPLAPEDEPNRYCIQLYHRTATQTDLSGKKVLEPSCGHGGGGAYLMKTLHPASYTGLDFNPDGVAFAKRRYDVPGLDFVHGDAENLPMGFLYCFLCFCCLPFEESHTKQRCSYLLNQVPICTKIAIRSLLDNDT